MPVPIIVVLVGILLLSAVAVLLAKGRLLPGILGLLVFLVLAMAMFPGLLVLGLVGLLGLAVVGAIRITAFRRGREGVIFGGLSLGSIAGGIVMGVVGYTSADPGWADLQTIGSAAVGVIIGGGVGGTLGWFLGRFLYPRQSAG